MTVQTAIRLPDDEYGRLKALAQRTGRTVTYYIREAIHEQLGDIEDAYLADEIVAGLRAGKIRTYRLDDVIAAHGLDD